MSKSKAKAGLIARRYHADRVAQEEAKKAADFKEALKEKMQPVSILESRCAALDHLPTRREFWDSFPEGNDIRNPFWERDYTKMLVRKHFGNWEPFVRGAEALSSVVAKYAEQARNAPSPFRDKVPPTPTEMVKRGLKFCLANDKYPSEGDLWALGFSIKAVEASFNSLAGFKNEILKSSPHKMKNFRDTKVWTADRAMATDARLSKAKIMFCTSFISGAKYSEEFYKSILMFSKVTGAEIVLFPVNGVSQIPEEFLDHHVVLEDLKVGKDMVFDEAQIRINQIDPAIGMNRVAPTGSSIVYGTTFQRLVTYQSRFVNSKPQSIGTGTLSLDQYINKDPKQTRLNKSAKQRHALGGIIMERGNDGAFHHRLVQAEKDGSFRDLDKIYTPQGVKSNIPAAIVRGDYHEIQKDVAVVKAYDDLCRLLKVDTIVLHDFVDGLYVNHHSKNLGVTRSRNLQKCAGLKEEIESAARTLNRYLKMFKNILIVRSNHDAFLDRELESSDWAHGDKDYKMFCAAAMAMSDGKNPVEFLVREALEKLPDYDPETGKNVRWMRANEVVTIEGVDVSIHGHDGGNGKKGNARALEASIARNAVIGNSHSPQVIAGLFVVGMECDAVQEYTKHDPGGNWLPACCVIHPGGAKQLVFYTNGRLRPEWATKPVLALPVPKTKSPKKSKSKKSKSK